MEGKGGGSCTKVGVGVIPMVRSSRPVVTITLRNNTGVYSQRQVVVGGGGGGLVHLPSGFARPVCTAGAFPILCLTTEVTTPPSHNCPFNSTSPLAVLPLYLPPCAPSHPIEIVEGPCLGEGVMITASQVSIVHFEM